MVVVVVVCGCNGHRLWCYAVLKNVRHVLGGDTGPRRATARVRQPKVVRPPRSSLVCTWSPRCPVPSVREITSKMGKTHMEYLYGERIYGCKSCAAHFSTIDSMISRVSTSRNSVSTISLCMNEDMESVTDYTLRDYRHSKASTVAPISLTTCKPLELPASHPSSFTVLTNKSLGVPASTSPQESPWNGR